MQQNELCSVSLDTTNPLLIPVLKALSRSLFQYHLWLKWDHLCFLFWPCLKSFQSRQAYCSTYLWIMLSVTLCVISLIVLLIAYFVGELAASNHSWLMVTVTTVKSFQFYVLSVVSVVTMRGSSAPVNLEVCYHDAAAGFFNTCNVKPCFAETLIHNCSCISRSLLIKYLWGLFWIWSQVGLELLAGARARIMQDIRSFYRLYSRSQSQLCSKAFLIRAPLYLPTAPGLCKIACRELNWYRRFHVAFICSCCQCFAGRTAGKSWLLKEGIAVHPQDLSAELQPSAAVFCPGDLHPAPAALARRLMLRNKVMSLS